MCIMPLKFIQSQKGHPMLLFKGYLYTRRSDNANGSITWRCRGYAKHSCHLVIHTTFDTKTGMHCVCYLIIVISFVLLIIFNIIII